MFKSPMLLHKATEPISHSSYIAELKLDGIRLILSTVSGQIQCWTRHGTRCTDRFPELAMLNLPPDTILDGELIVTDEQSHPDFEAILTRFQTTNEHKIRTLMKSDPVQFCVFDVLMIGGQDVTSLPLHERKAILQDQIKEQPHLSLVRSIPGEQAGAFFDLVSQQNLEGIVLKKVNSTYQVGKRSYDWLKVINYQYFDVRLTAIRKGDFGWLIGLEDEGRVRPAGLIEFPPPPNVRKAVWSIVNKVKVGEDKKFIYLKPAIRMKVKSRGFTKRGLIRLPVFHAFNFGGKSYAV
ncbi:RNA ligase family protein [Laceyella putida]|uniref:RNA ligase family protein n=1 Tax=Laceyella putida TaxID=110101 RepID=A0ABW2RQR4_9BACL